MLNVAFRFGAEQSDKIRDCDDIRHSLANLSCVVITPGKLVSWDHLSEMRRRISTVSQGWDLFNADHAAAYKQPPLEWAKHSLASVALRSPGDGRRYGFTSRTLLFGAIAAVLHYNVFSRIIDSLGFRCFGTPAISYFDDFGSLLPATLAARGLAVSTSFREHIGVTLAGRKSEVGPKIAYLVLLGEFRSVDNGIRPTVTLTPGKLRDGENTPVASSANG